MMAFVGYISLFAVMPIFSADAPEAYLFAHMLKEDYGRLYYSVSTDGLHWQMLNDRKRISEEYRGHPDICRGHDGRFYMTGGSKTVTIWVSDDLISWSLFLDFNPDVYKTPNFTPAEDIHGAPKIFYDRSTSQYMITWHTSQNRKLKEDPEFYWAGQRTLYILSKDLRTFTEPKRLFQYDMATIDVIVRRVCGRYYAILKDERYPSFDWTTGKTIRIASSSNLTGPWTEPSPPITKNFREAPTLVPRPDGEGWYLYSEQYPGVQYTVSTAPQICGPWYDLHVHDHSLPENVRHGCIITITKEEYDRLMSVYGR